MTKTDAPDIDATYHSILKDEDAAAVLGKLLPPSDSIDSCEKKGTYFLLLLFFIQYHFFVLADFFFYFLASEPMK